MILGIKGMNDVRPGATDAFLDSAVWSHIFAVSSRVMGSYGYLPVWLPLVEDTALFTRGIGEGTDIVSKEMYSFSDRGERQLTLRPEGTASSARAYIEHNLGRGDAVQRWSYAGPMFRAERPQKGRYRQFYQVGAEFFGVADASADAELLLMLSRLCEALQLKDVQIRINTLGDDASRVAYRAALLTYLRAHSDALCESCKGRMEANPLRVLDCKRESCRQVVRGAPDILASLTPEAKAHFARLEALLHEGGLSYTRDPLLVRGLDYYTGPIFEFTTGALGSQDAILGGGRYDNLVSDLGGPSTPAVGFAAGVERLAMLISAQAEDPTQALPAQAGPHLYCVPMDASALPKAFALADQLRQISAWRVEVDHSGAKVKKQMSRADKLQARTALVLGADELQSGRAQLKDLRSKRSVEVALTPEGLHAGLAEICGA